MNRMKRCKVFCLGLTVAMLLMHAAVCRAAMPADTKMSINVNSMPVEQVLKDIHNKAKIDFVYDAELSKNWPKISLHATNKSAEEIIKELISKLNCEYTMKGSIVTITQQRVSGSERSGQR